MSCSVAMVRKYWLAVLVNCSNMLIGKKVSAVYLAERTRLVPKITSCRAPLWALCRASTSTRRTPPSSSSRGSPPPHTCRATFCSAPRGCAPIAAGASVLRAKQKPRATHAGCCPVRCVLQARLTPHLSHAQGFLRRPGGSAPCGAGCAPPARSCRVALPLCEVRRGGSLSRGAAVTSQTPPCARSEVAGAEPAQPRSAQRRLWHAPRQPNACICMPGEKSNHPRPPNTKVRLFLGSLNVSCRLFASAFASRCRLRCMELLVSRGRKCTAANF